MRKATDFPTVDRKISPPRSIPVARQKILPWRDALAVIVITGITALCLIQAFKSWNKVENRCVHIHPDGSQQVDYEADYQKYVLRKASSVFRAKR